MLAYVGLEAQPVSTNITRRASCFPLQYKRKTQSIEPLTLLGMNVGRAIKRHGDAVAQQLALCSVSITLVDGELSWVVVEVVLPASKAGFVPGSMCWSMSIAASWSLGLAPSESALYLYPTEADDDAV
jgi:hypothetical protein